MLFTKYEDILFFFIFFKFYFIFKLYIIVLVLPNIKKINCIKMGDLLSYILSCIRLLVILPLSFYLCAFHPSTMSPLTPGYLYQLQTLSFYTSLAKAALESICSVFFLKEKDYRTLYYIFVNFVLHVSYINAN